MINLPAFLSPEECVELIEQASPHLVPAETATGQHTKRVVSSYRVALVHKFLEDTPLTTFIKEQAAKLTNSNISQVEDLQIVKYEPGGYFKRHSDGDWRKHTLAIYLNPDYTGGELVFTKPKSLRFSNMLPGSALLFDSSLMHEALPVLSGEKWVITCWVDFP